MEDMVGFLETIDGLPGKILGLDGLPLAIVLMIVSLSVFGAVLVNNLADRRYVFEYAFSFAMMLLGAVIANLVLFDKVLLIDNAIAMAAIFSNIGMVFSGLTLMVIYRLASPAGV